MSAEENKAVSRRWFEEVFSGGNLEAADEIVADDVVFHESATPGLPDGIEGARLLVSTYRSAFPDLHFTIEDVFAEGDRVAIRWTVRGTNDGDLPDIPATGRHPTVTGITIDRFRGGQDRRKLDQPGHARNAAKHRGDARARDDRRVRRPAIADDYRNQ